MVSSELEAILAERFPELSPLLLETSFSNKEAPWRQQGRAIASGSNSPSRAASLSVSRAGSITQPRYGTTQSVTLRQDPSSGLLRQIASKKPPNS